MKIGNKKELRKIAEEKSSHIIIYLLDSHLDYDYCTREPYSFMMIDARPTVTIPFKKKTLMNQ